MNAVPNERTKVFEEIFNALHSFVLYDDGELRYIAKVVADELTDVGLQMLIDDLKELYESRKERTKSLARASAKIQKAIKKRSGPVRTVKDLVDLLKKLQPAYRDPETGKWVAGEADPWLMDEASHSGRTSETIIRLAKLLAKEAGIEPKIVTNKDELDRAVKDAKEGDVIIFVEGEKE